MSAQNFELPERLRRLEVSVKGDVKADLLREGPYSLVYSASATNGDAVSLLMPTSKQVYTNGELFPSMDMNLPEGYLFQRILELHRKFKIQKLHLLALAGESGIGRVGFRLPDAPVRRIAPVSRQEILSAADGETMFEELMRAYLQGGSGISGVQPKVMVPSRATLPAPDLIIKVAGAEFPGLSANEFMCLSAGRHAGIEVPGFDLSQDGKILVIDRFDLGPNGERLGFEDMAALMALVVHDALSTRKYTGSYEAIAEVIGAYSSQPAADLSRFFEQLALSVMVRNGDAHLKNFGMLYSTESDVRLAPMFDVVTTAIYAYERPGGFQDYDRTLALKLRRGRSDRARTYPITDELLAFGRDVCLVPKPQDVISRIAEGMSAALGQAQGDERIPRQLLEQMRPLWDEGMRYAIEATRQPSTTPASRRVRRP